MEMKKLYFLILMSYNPISCLSRYWRYSMIFIKQFLLSSKLLFVWLLLIALMFPQSITIFSYISPTLWHSDNSWHLKSSKASFQLNYQIRMNALSFFVTIFNFHNLFISFLFLNLYINYCFLNPILRNFCVINIGRTLEGKISRQNIQWEIKKLLTKFVG